MVLHRACEIADKWVKKVLLRSTYIYLKCAGKVVRAEAMLVIQDPFHLSRTIQTVFRLACWFHSPFARIQMKTTRIHQCNSAISKYSFHIRFRPTRFIQIDSIQCALADPIVMWSGAPRHIHFIRMVDNIHSKPIHLKLI